jgi:hypothetical protein
MAAQEQQRKRVVPVGAGEDRAVEVGTMVGRLRVVGRVERRGGFAAAAGAVGAPRVDPCPTGHGQQPRSRPIRYSFGWPLQRRREQRLLHGVLVGVELTVPADQRAQDLRRELAQQVLNPVLAGHRAGICGPVTAAPSGP